MLFSFWIIVIDNIESRIETFCWNQFVNQNIKNKYIYLSHDND